jgi:hypothetical protein
LIRNIVGWQRRTVAVGTKYDFMSDKEFLVQVEPLIRKSPIIDALVDRLNSLINSSKSLQEDEEVKVSCPICEATLKISLGEGNSGFELTE